MTGNTAAYHLAVIHNRYRGPNRCAVAGFADIRGAHVSGRFSCGTHASMTTDTASRYG
jgi:hypothetical protein